MATSATKIGRVSINPQGEYSSGTQYQRLDVVTYNGSGYICIKDCQNKPVSNTEYWYLLVAKGDAYEVTEEDLQRIASQIEEDASSLFNQLVAQKTSEFNANAVSKTEDFNANATSKTEDFDDNASDKTDDFNTNATNKTDAFNTNATQKGISFNANYDDKLGLFNGNATTKTQEVNQAGSTQVSNVNQAGTTQVGNVNSAGASAVGDVNTAKDNAITDIESAEDLAIQNIENEGEYYAKHIQALEDNFDIATTPNSNDFTLTDSASGFIPRDNEGKPKEIKIGETELEQVTTTGKNIADTSAITETTFKGVTFSPVYKNGLLEYVDVNGTATETSYIDVATKIYDAGNYILTGSPTGGSNEKYQQRLVKTTGFESVAVDNGSGVLISINGTDSYFIRIRIASGYTANHLKFYPMLRLASVSDDTYEPYSGGQASPSPDYPQDIHIVEGECSVEESNKNLAIEANGIWYMGTDNIFYETSACYGFKAKVKPNTRITISKKNVGNRFVIIGSKNEIEKNQNYNSVIFTDNESTRTSYSFITGDNDYYIFFGCYRGTDSIAQKSACEGVQIEQSTIATSYVPHKSNTFPLTLPQGMFLGKIGTSSNYIYGTKDNWKLHSGLAKVVLDGSENWKIGNSGTVNWMYELTLQDIKLLADIGKSNLYLLVNVLNSNTEQGFSIKINSTNNKNLLRVRYGTENTIENWKAQLTENNMIVYGCQETPTETDITDTTLIAQLNNMIDNLQTYKGETVVFTTGSDLAPNIQFEYMVNPLTNIEARLDLDEINYNQTVQQVSDHEIRITRLEKANHVYGIKRARNNNSSSTWERTDDAISLVANAQSGTTAVRNDFDNRKPWSNIIRKNIDLGTGKTTAYYGEAEFKLDGSNGDVYTEIPDIYWKVWQDEDYDYVQIADGPMEGFTKTKSFDIQSYLTGYVDSKLRSYSGITPARSVNIGTYRNRARALGNNFCLLDWRYFVIQLLYLVEYADYNSQAKLGKGITSVRDSDLDKALIAETNANRIIISTNGNGNFIIGQTISIGNTAKETFQVAEGKVITEINEYDDGTITGVEIVFDGSPVNIAVGNVIWSSGQHSGGGDFLGMKSGCYEDDGKHSVNYRGIENVFGNVYPFVDGINIKNGQAYICYDPIEYTSDKFTEPYEAIGYINAYNGNDNYSGYAKTLGFDSNHPLVRFPTELGGSSSTYMTDNYYTSTGNRVARAGGNLLSGFYAGLWYWNLLNASSSSTWNYGARVIKYQ